MIDQFFSHRLLVLAGIMGASGVAIGAFGAHGLETVLQNQAMDAPTIAKRLGQFDVGVRYQMYHAIAMLALASLSTDMLPKRGIVAGLWLFGTLLFSGSLYGLVLTNTTWLGAITPIGGTAWIVAWILLGVWGWPIRS